MNLTPQQIENFKVRFPLTIENELMSKHTSYRLGGPARLYVIATSADDLVAMIEYAEEQKIPWYVFGGGTNLLVADEGFTGLVIQAANRQIKIDGQTVLAESGIFSVLVARQTVEAGFTGFEWAVGLPGSIGGAIYGNGGCYGGEMKDHLVTVDAYRLSDHKRVTMAQVDCQFGYRDSVFKHERYLILGCTMKLAKADDPVGLKKKFQETLAARQDQQPLGQSSAGCIFKNPQVTQKDIDYLLERGYQPMFGHDSKDHVSAGWLIETAGMMGQVVGGVKVSNKHGNFFVNSDKATAQDVITLISFVKMKVRDELGIELQEEVQYLI